MCNEVEGDASQCEQDAYSKLGKIYIEAIDLTQRYVTEENDGGTGVGKGPKANDYFNNFHFNERVYLSDTASYINSIYLAEATITQNFDRFFGSTIGKDSMQQF